DRVPQTPGPPADGLAGERERRTMSSEEMELSGLLRGALSPSAQASDRMRARLRAAMEREQAEAKDAAAWGGFGRIMLRAGQAMGRFAPALREQWTALTP